MEYKYDELFNEPSEIKRRKLLYILHYLLEYSDEDNYASSADIIAYLIEYYGISVNRQTVYADIKILRDCGELFNIEIDGVKSKKGFRILERDFDSHDLQLLVDCVQSSKFITARKAKDLTDRLKKLTNEQNRSKLDRRTYVDNRIKNMHDRTFYALDNIYPAISGDYKITFRYFNYNVNKEKQYSEKKYIASPYAVIYSEGNYYLIAYEGGMIKHFRIDKMENVQRYSREKRDGKGSFSALKFSERKTKVFSMFSGREERIELRFSNNLVGVVLDHFGMDIDLIPDGDSHFIALVDVEVSPQFFGWLCGLGRGVRILHPYYVVNEMRGFIGSISRMYKDDK
jgi:predicted DNA-binding transcriptional regulator YafY